MSSLNPHASDMTRKQILEQIDAAEKAEEKLKDHPADRLIPNPTQWDWMTYFHAASICAELPFGMIRQMCICGANQYGGKTFAQVLLAFFHLTGLYPKGWNGPKWDRPIRSCFGARTFKKTRELFTNVLLGPYNKRGSGWMPSSFVSPDRCEQAASQPKGTLWKFEVRHKNWKTGRFDGWSECYLFSYGAGWEDVAGFTYDLVQPDEECPFMMYEEMKARTNFTGGLTYLSMVPLYGDSLLYDSFENDPTGTKRIIHYSVEMCTHLSPTQIKQARLEYRGNPYEKARLDGYPVTGSGILLKTPNKVIVIDDFPIPHHFPRIIGLDFMHTSGWWAAGLIAIDPVTKRQYLIDSIKMEGASEDEFGAAVRRMGGSWFPCAWPHDNIRDKQDGRPLATRLRDDQGLNMLTEHAYMLGIDGSRTNSPIAALEVLGTLMGKGMFRVFQTCQGFLEEKLNWKQKDGRIVKNQMDHEIDAVLKAEMMISYARPDKDPRNRPTKLTRPEYNFYG